MDQRENKIAKISHEQEEALRILQDKLAVDGRQNLVDKLLYERGKITETEIDETSYLMSSKKNHQRLMQAMADLEAGKGRMVTLYQISEKYHFSKKSLAQLSSCHPELQELFNEVIKGYDCVIIQGQRSSEEQLKAFQEGKTKIKSGGKHNQNPSLAVDVAPYPIDWQNIKRFYHFAGYVQAVAEILSIKIRWGGDWDQDKDFADNKFNDLVHFELVV